MARWFFLILCAVPVLMLPQETKAASRTLTRRQIRSMPMVARPNRPGHFFGNTVRWLARR